MPVATPVIAALPTACEKNAMPLHHDHRADAAQQRADEDRHSMIALTTKPYAERLRQRAGDDHLLTVLPDRFVERGHAPFAWPPARPDTSNASAICAGVSTSSGTPMESHGAIQARDAIRQAAHLRQIVRDPDAPSRLRPQARAQISRTARMPASSMALSGSSSTSSDGCGTQCLREQQALTFAAGKIAELARALARRAPRAPARPRDFLAMRRASAEEGRTPLPDHRHEIVDRDRAACGRDRAPAARSRWWRRSRRSRRWQFRLCGHLAEQRADRARSCRRRSAR